MVLVVGVRADPLRKAKILGLGAGLQAYVPHSNHSPFHTSRQAWQPIKNLSMIRVNNMTQCWENLHAVSQTGLTPQLFRQHRAKFVAEKLS